MAYGFQSDADAREYYQWKVDQQRMMANQQLAGLAQQQQQYGQSSLQQALMQNIPQREDYAGGMWRGVACTNQDVNEYGTSGMEIMTRGYTDEDLILLL